MYRAPLIAAVLLGFAAAGVATTTAPDPGPPPREEPRQSEEPGPPQRAADQAGRSPGAPALAPFRRDRRPEDSIPRIYRGGPLTENLDVDSARRVRSPDGRSAWLVPGARDRVCVLRSAAVNCVEAEQLTRDGFTPAMSWRRGEPVHLAGLAADGAGTVLVTLIDGRRVSVTPQENVVAAELPAAIGSIEWAGPRGRESLALPLHQQEAMQAAVDAAPAPELQK